jgi:hypothetical protein
VCVCVCALFLFNAHPNCPILLGAVTLCIVLQAPDGRLVFLKTQGDMRVYRFMMGVCGFGLAATGVCLYMMATGSMPRKERSS